MALLILALLQRIFLMSSLMRSEERFSRNAETDLVCRLLLEKKNRPEQMVLLDSLQREIPGLKHVRAAAPLLSVSVRPSRSKLPIVRSCVCRFSALLHLLFF